MLSTFTWDPDRVFFIIPYIHHPVMWYGILFAVGFIVGFYLLKKMFLALLEDSKEAIRLADQSIIFLVAGTLIGARLGHILFYGLHYYSVHPWSIFKVWEGGLASHGGAIGILIAMGLFIWINRKKQPLTFLTFLDLVVVPTAFAAFCIRIGNFINQEITGVPTSLPWGVNFLHPIDGYPGLPVHPVQLYEAFFFLLLFFALFTLWARDKKSLGRGLLSGLFLFLTFTFRFGIEYLKMPQNDAFDANGWIKMGQLLSIPFIIAGGCLLVRYRRFLCSAQKIRS